MERLYNPSHLEKIRNYSIKEENLRHKVINSPVGLITLVADESALLLLQWGEKLPKSLSKSLKGSNSILKATERQLKEYFKKKRKSFTIPLCVSGTDFQKTTWEELLKIPYGETITYGEQAKRMKNPKAVRAVGAANGKNPIGIIIPCHRVIGASGSLTGFAGGLKSKRCLLEIERYQTF